MGSIRWTQASTKITNPTPLRLGSKLPSLAAPPLKRRGEVALLKPLKPLLFRGGVGVGSVPTRQRLAKITNPTPLRLGSKLPSLAAPPLQGRGWGGVCPPDATFHQVHKPHPAATRQQAAKSRLPSPEEEGRGCSPQAPPLQGRGWGGVYPPDATLRLEDRPHPRNAPIRPHAARKAVAVSKACAPVSARVKPIRPTTNSTLPLALNTGAVSELSA